MSCRRLSATGRSGRQAEVAPIAQEVSKDTKLTESAARCPDGTTTLDDLSDATAACAMTPGSHDAIWGPSEGFYMSGGCKDEATAFGEHGNAKVHGSQWAIVMARKRDLDCPLKSSSWRGPKQYIIGPQNWFRDVVPKQESNSVALAVSLDM